ncbi:MAG TPA: response regulator transcription factor [Chloroflexota bacterium]|nr:response regulator transcription factor [Chloroflexota bacterium]
MTSAYVVAAQPALRAGLRAMLQEAGIAVVGEGASVPRRTEAGVLLAAADLEPEDFGSLDELGLPAVVLSDAAGAGSALQGLGLPGWAVLPADAGAEQLTAAVQAAAQGLAAMPAENLPGLTTRTPVEVSDALQEPLTPRELEVLQLVSQGLSNKLIARQLQISEHTVKFHVSSTYAKLGAASRTEAVSLAARRGLISL